MVRILYNSKFTLTSKIAWNKQCHNKEGQLYFHFYDQKLCYLNLWFRILEMLNIQPCTWSILFSATICSPLSYPNVLYGSKSCSRNFSGYSCTVTCDESYVLQAHDSTTTQVDCFDGSGWDEVIPSCVPGK